MKQKSLDEVLSFFAYVVDDRMFDGLNDRTKTTMRFCQIHLIQYLFYCYEIANKHLQPYFYGNQASLNRIFFVDFTLFMIALFIYLVFS